MSLGMGTVIGIAVAAIIVVIFNELGQSYYRNYCRSYYYKMAAKHALKIGKPLIVLGCPHNGLEAKLHGPAYGPGNFTIDISGCTKGICEDVMERSALKSFKAFLDNSCVVFISCVLEYLEENEIKQTIQEIERVAGDQKNIFVVTVGTSSLSAYYYTSNNNGKHKDIAHRVFMSSPPEGPFKYQEINQKKSTRRNL
jgi:hypothetical protein